MFEFGSGAVTDAVNARALTLVQNNNSLLQPCWALKNITTQTAQRATSEQAISNTIHFNCSVISCKWLVSRCSLCRKLNVCWVHVRLSYCCLCGHSAFFFSFSVVLFTVGYHKSTVVLTIHVMTCKLTRRYQFLWCCTFNISWFLVLVLSKEFVFIFWLIFLTRRPFKNSLVFGCSEVRVVCM